MAGVSAPLKAAPLEAGVSAPVKAAPLEAVWLAHVPCAADPLLNAGYLPLDCRQESCFHSYSFTLTVPNPVYTFISPNSRLNSSDFRCKQLTKITTVVPTTVDQAQRRI
jgi:hypothetical protein